AGAGQVCHLFDTFEGRQVQGGVSQPCLTDAILLDDRVFVEIIADGHHVPPLLIELARRCAGAARIIAITDCMQGTGLPDGVYREGDGREFRLTNGEVCRLTDGSRGIVGSCLTMDAAFRNLTGKFGFSISEASRMLSGNPARALKLQDRSGELRAGLQADITILEPETQQVESCLVSGKRVFQKTR
ncbi:MAG: amidohydrolase family protein, partial [Lentisphaeria bacterium]|nr:amidohydrolase family protein [Lentisphaeria bacterium]